MHRDSLRLSIGTFVIVRDSLVLFGTLGVMFGISRLSFGTQCYWMGRSIVLCFDILVQGELASKQWGV